jgi:hypothetical protein
MAVVGGSVALLVGASATPAMADNKSIGDEHGVMTFIDDGDVFKVCDTRVDDHGVTGKVIKADYWTPAETVVLTVTDGGDAGCGKAGYNIGNLHHYKMVLYWNGKEIDSTGWFNE